VETGKTRTEGAGDMTISARASAGAAPSIDPVRGILGAMRRAADATGRLPDDDPGIEAGLLARARAGDREAFGGLVDLHLRRIWGLVWRIVRQREDTEDVVQEVFLTAWQSLRDFRGDARLATWLGRIAVTRALNHVDRGAEKVSRASMPLGAAPGSVADDAPSAPEPADERPAASPLRALEGREMARRLADCLKRLPAVWRAALALRQVDGRSYDEIAAALGVALGTVRSRLARARLALKECIERES
jgi:RNA polymerase sigma-70 factor (ECF subfamily)